MTDVTRDAFLGGRLHLWQPAKGYRAGIDPVLLAASVDALPGQSVLDLGCGGGAAMLCLGTRVPDLHLTGVEVQAEYATLARRNAAEAGIAAEVICADLRDLPGDLRQRQFDHVIMNPPYFDRAQGVAAGDAGRDTARGGDTPLADWIDVGVRRVAPRGFLTLIQQTARLHDVLAALHGRLGSVLVQPLAARADRPAHLVLVQARQGGRTPFALAAPLILHDGNVHMHDAADYTLLVQGILRRGDKLPIRD